MFAKLFADLIAFNLTNDRQILIHEDMTGPTDFIAGKAITAKTYSFSNEDDLRTVFLIITEYDNVSFYKTLFRKGTIRFCVWNN